MNPVPDGYQVVRGGAGPAPAVSLLMAAYNAAPYLRAAMDSILTQPGVDLELIVVNDASTDATLEAALAVTDPRVTVMSGAVNRGLFAARNAAAALARAPWLAVFDADDLLAPGLLAPYLAAAEHAVPAAEWAYCGMTFMDDQDQPLPAMMRNPFDLLKMLQRNIAPDPLSLVRRAMFHELGGYRQEYRVGEDYDLKLRLLWRGAPFFYDAIGVRYRRHGGNVTTGTPDGAPAVRARWRREVEAAPGGTVWQDVVRQGLRFLDAAQGGPPGAVLALGDGLRQHGVESFELDRHWVAACLRMGCRAPARARLHGWIVRLAEGRRVLPYEAVWAVTGAVQLAVQEPATGYLRAILPVARAVAATVRDAELDRWLAAGQLSLAANPAAPPSAPCGVR